MLIPVFPFLVAGKPPRPPIAPLGPPQNSLPSLPMQVGVSLSLSLPFFLIFQLQLSLSDLR